VGTYDKVQEIIPSAIACGTHVFHPLLAKAPSLVDDEDDQGEDESVMGKESGRSSVITSFSGQQSKSNSR
jgi:hypothetical protein